MPRAPCTKNQPPIAGSIQWSRALMRRIKKPMLRFQSYEEIMNSTEGQNATKIYISVGKAMREYENKLDLWARLPLDRRGAHARWLATWMPDRGWWQLKQLRLIGEDEPATR